MPAPPPAASLPSPMVERIETRLDRLGLAPEEATRRAGLPPGSIARLLAGQAPSPRGQALRKLAEVLECSISYLVGLDPDVPPPPEVLEEAQADFGLLSGDQEALLAAYARLDHAGKQALLVARRMAGPEPVPEPTKPKRRR
ncbi:helix-turn-helix transcriptional regulator [Roseomonas sp. OT10]|uniref:helix-turn-helix domain-containing protein n=1 Tax=Roseomonas cutis TaxID=2897332 RepID=UPI001E5DE3A6|nr:helix-turn-helix transcriptional regulator [Roseomonas sp. OT10]UFN48167.1 helix-turn-helix transcriptional regulator [Roseomonas sp. OT10]